MDEFKYKNLFQIIIGKSNFFKFIKKNKIKLYKKGFILQEKNKTFKILDRDIESIRYETLDECSTINVYLVTENKKITNRNKRLLQINCDEYPYLLDAFKIVSNNWGINENNLTDTTLWFNITYVLITIKDGFDWHYVGGLERYSETQNRQLQKLFDVYEKDNADKKIQWLLAGGYNSLFKENCPSSTLYKRIKSDFDQLGIIGWDFCCVIHISGLSYLHGYYTFEEAMNISLPVAKRLQKLFNSWDRLALNYLYGYEYYSNESPLDMASDLFELYEIYRRLLNNETGPYKLEWNTELKKEW